MGQLWSANGLVGYAIEAQDGLIGTAGEFYFDDYEWVVRHLVVELRRWLMRTHVLLRPGTWGRPDQLRRVIPVPATRAALRHGPPATTDLPVALQEETRRHPHYSWEMYWAAEALAYGTEPGALAPVEPSNADGAAFDPHLRTTRVVTGHAVRGPDGLAGVVDDFLLDDEHWTVRHLVVNTREDRKVLLEPELVRHISFEDQSVYVDITEGILTLQPTLDSVTVGAHRTQRQSA